MEKQDENSDKIIQQNDNYNNFFKQLKFQIKNLSSYSTNNITSMDIEKDDHNNSIFSKSESKLKSIKHLYQPYIEKLSTDKKFSQMMIRKTLYKDRLKSLTIINEISFDILPSKNENKINLYNEHISIAECRVIHKKYMIKQKKTINSNIVNEDDYSDDSIDYSMIPIVNYIILMNRIIQLK
jgi:hypothetical protein